MSGLSEQLQIGSRSVTEIVDGLEAKALVERRPDPQDREATLVAVTEHGIQVGQAIRSAPAAAIEITE